jgi:hypothetical protein
MRMVLPTTEILGRVNVTLRWSGSTWSYVDPIQGPQPLTDDTLIDDFNCGAIPTRVRLRVENKSGAPISIMVTAKVGSIDPEGCHSVANGSISEPWVCTPSINGGEWDVALCNGADDPVFKVRWGTGGTGDLRSPGSPE